LRGQFLFFFRQQAKDHLPLNVVRFRGELPAEMIDVELGYGPVHSNKVLTLKHVNEGSRQVCELNQSIADGSRRITRHGVANEIAEARSSRESVRDTVSIVRSR